VTEFTCAFDMGVMRSVSTPVRAWNCRCFMRPVSTTYLHARWEKLCAASCGWIRVHGIRSVRFSVCT
jgi:hypothetical protein